MARKPTPRFDYEYLSGLQSEDAPREVFLLDEAAQQVLSQLADIVLWPTRWDNFDDADLDHIEFRSAIYEALKVPYHFDDLIPLLDDLEPLLQALIDAQCCAPGGGPVGGFDGEVVGFEGDIDEPPNVTPGTELPPGWVDHPDNPGDDSWDLELYRIALCDQINRLADAIGSTIRRWSMLANFNAWDFARELAQSTIAFLFPGRVDDLVLWAWDAYYDAVDAIGSWVSGLLGLNAGDALAQIYADWVAQGRADFVCALFEASNADSGAEDARSVLQGLHAGAAWSLIWAAFPMRFIVRRMFDMELGYEGPYQSSCDCEGGSIYDFEYTFSAPFFNPSADAVFAGNWALLNGADWSATNTPEFSQNNEGAALSASNLAGKVGGAVTIGEIAIRPFRYGSCGTQPSLNVTVEVNSGTPFSENTGGNLATDYSQWFTWSGLSLDFGSGGNVLSVFASMSPACNYIGVVEVKISGWV